MRCKLLFASFMVLLPITAHGQEATSKGITVTNAWARATPGGATVAAAFLEIKADKDTTDRLTGVSTPVAENAEVHSSALEDGVMKMRRVDGLDVKPGETVTLKPMGNHIMLFKLKQPLKEGDHVDLTLTFEKAGPIAVQANVQSLAAAGPEEAHHHHPEGDASDSMSHDQGGAHTNDQHHGAH